MKTFVVGLVVLVAFGIAIGAQENPAEYLSKRVREADKVEIELYSNRIRQKVSFGDPAWIERMAKVLESGKYTSEAHCFSISFPRIELYRKGELIGELSIHHDRKLRAYAGLVQGDFEVGPEMGAAIIELANERKGSMAVSPAPATGAQEQQKG